jgi:xanthine dehydrogenase YagT iron-sulfur-binding subunit
MHRDESCDDRRCGACPGDDADKFDVVDAGMPPLTRRGFVAGSAALGSTALTTTGVAQTAAVREAAALDGRAALALVVNGQQRTIDIDVRTTLLDLLREAFGLYGTKKGCDHGQCGACTVLIDGQRINSCLALAVCHDAAAITTIEGLASGEQLHPLQSAFMAHDAFQCGYCTPGQICSAVGMLDEARRGAASHVSADVRLVPTSGARLTDAEIRERLSGNLCRCGAYPGILAAVREVSGPTPRNASRRGSRS